MLMIGSAFAHVHNIIAAVAGWAGGALSGPLGGMTSLAVTRAPNPCLGRTLLPKAKVSI